jgi:hypothetical protein
VVSLRLTGTRLVRGACRGKGAGGLPGLWAIGVRWPGLGWSGRKGGRVAGGFDQVHPLVGDAGPIRWCARWGRWIRCRPGDWGPSPRRCAGGSSTCSAPRPATCSMTCSLARVRWVGPGPRSRARRSRRVRRRSARCMRPGPTRRNETSRDASSPAASDASHPSSEALHGRLRRASSGSARTFPRRAPSRPGCGS